MKLEFYGIRGKALDMFTTYMTERLDWLEENHSRNTTWLKIETYNNGEEV